MLLIAILGSVLFWCAAAVILSPKRRALRLMDRLGRWFFASALVLTVLLWTFVPIAQADRAGDSTVTARIPDWYDAILELWIPNAMLAVAASAAWGASGAGLFLRFKLYTLLVFNWYYLAEVLPWGMSAKAHAGNRYGRLTSPYQASGADLLPLAFISAASVALFLLLYGFIATMERHLRSYALPSSRAVNSEQ